MLTLTSPEDTWLHHVPAGLKLALMLAITIGMLNLDNPIVTAVLLAGVCAFYLSFGWSFFRHGMSLMRPLLPFAVVVLLWHAWTGDLADGTVIVMRFVVAVAIANLVTMTTRLTDMIAVVENITPTIGWLGLKPRKLALAIALTIRFLPVLSQKIGQIEMAWRGRSARRARWRILVPTVLAVLDDADHVADALRARGGADPIIEKTGD